MDLAACARVRYHAPLVQHYLTLLTGARLLKDLVSFDKMAEVAARRWIEEETGCAYDASACYKLRWSAETPPGKGWKSLEGLMLGMASPDGVARLERELREPRTPPRLKPGNRRISRPRQLDNDELHDKE